MYYNRMKNYRIIYSNNKTFALVRLEWKKLNKFYLFIKFEEHPKTENKNPSLNEIPVIFISLFRQKRFQLLQKLCKKYTEQTGIRAISV